jgi:hypothetical protein
MVRTVWTVWLFEATVWYGIRVGEWGVCWWCGWLVCLSVDMHPSSILDDAEIDNHQILRASVSKGEEMRIQSLLMMPHKLSLSLMKWTLSSCCCLPDLMRLHGEHSDGGACLDLKDLVIDLHLASA